MRITNLGGVEFGGPVSVGPSAADASAAFDVQSTDKGFLPPRMTTTERDAIGSPATGLVIYNTTTNQLEVFDGTWGAVGGDNQEDVFTWVLNGALDTGVAQAGLRAARKSGTIVGVVVTARQKGGVGTSTFDINKHIPTKPITTQRDNTAGTTVYTTQGNRPTIVGAAANTENAIKQAVDPDVTTFAAGDFFSLDVDTDGASGGNSPMDMVVELFIKYNAT